MHGPVSATLGTAKDLRGLGHQVLYCGFADGQALVQQNGFEFIPIFSFPDSLRLESMLNEALRLRDVASFAHRYRSFLGRQVNQFDG
jgi:hypothetical protein